MSLIVRTRIRKLQKIGDSHYIALPPDWVKHYGLKKSDKLLVQYDDGPIITIKIPNPKAGED